MERKKSETPAWLLRRVAGSRVVVGQNKELCLFLWRGKLTEEEERLELRRLGTSLRK